MRTLRTYLAGQSRQMRCGTADARRWGCLSTFIEFPLNKDRPCNTDPKRLCSSNPHLHAETFVQLNSDRERGRGVVKGKAGEISVEFWLKNVAAKIAGDSLTTPCNLQESAAANYPPTKNKGRNRITSDYIRLSQIISDYHPLGK